jgi:hypothetical protein
MAADFQYKSGGSWLDVPWRAAPEAGKGSVIVCYPKAADRTGSGVPCGAFGLPWIEIRAGEMIEGSDDTSGMRFWQTFFASATALTAAISLTAYDPRARAWGKYAGTLERPEYESPIDDALNSGRVYRSVIIYITGIATTT